MSKTSTVRPAPSILTDPLQRFPFLGLIGAGDVILKKIWPALCALQCPFEEIAVCSLEPSSPLNHLDHTYYQIQPDGLLPLAERKQRSFLSEEAIWLVCSPTPFHLRGALQLRGAGRIVVEKPLTSNAQQARKMLSLSQRIGDIYPLDHKLYCESALEMVDLFRSDSSLLDQVSRIEGVFYETFGVPHGRQIDDTIADIQYHLLVITRSLFQAAGRQVKLAPCSVETARYSADADGAFAAPAVPTASRVRGMLLSRGDAILLDFRQAKAAPHSEKAIRLYNASGALLHAINLNESGWKAHARALTALMQPVPEPIHTLEDAVCLMEWVDLCRSIAREKSPYPFGQWPGILPKGAVS
jgi:hypothetical protein